MTPILFDKAALIQGLYSILPELILIATAIAVLLADLVLPEIGKKRLCHLGISGTATGAAMIVSAIGITERPIKE